MLRSAVAILSLVAVAGGLPVLYAHSMDQAAVLLDFHGNSVDAELQLPLCRIETALGARFAPQDPMQVRALTAYLLRRFSAALADGREFRVESINAPRLLTIEGASYVVARLRLTPPAGMGADLFELHSAVLLDRVPAQVTLVSVRSDWRTGAFANELRLLGVVRAGNSTVLVDRRAASWWTGFGGIFRLGMRHIAEGTDHLLFLLTLLLPASLVAVRGRWKGEAGVRRSLLHIGRVVTAFTLGHSLTLALGAFDLVRVPSRVIETLIAVSILVSAVHAMRPLFPGKEAVIAASFGLIHGLAFAATLAELGLGRWERAASLLAFNLGIETMQLVVVAAAMPAVILLSRTMLFPSLRIFGATLAGVAAMGWIAQRLWNVSNPADALVSALAQEAVWIAAGFTLLGLLARSYAPTRSYQALGDESL